MAIGEITNPYEFFTNADGTPLEAGQIYIGVDGLDPQDNPQAAYFDLAGTIGATQPIRTLGGYPVNAGSATKIFTDGSFSVKVLDENNNLVYSDLSVSQIVDDVDAVTARVDDMAVPFDTVADFFAASLADIKAKANATTGTAYVEISNGGYRCKVDLTQVASGAYTTAQGVKFTPVMAHGNEVHLAIFNPTLGLAADNSDQIEAAVEFLASLTYVNVLTSKKSFAPKLIYPAGQIRFTRKGILTTGFDDPSVVSEGLVHKGVSIGGTSLVYDNTTDTETDSYAADTGKLNILIFEDMSIEVKNGKRFIKHHNLGSGGGAWLHHNRCRIEFGGSSLAKYLFCTGGTLASETIWNECRFIGRGEGDFLFSNCVQSLNHNFFGCSAALFDAAGGKILHFERGGNVRWYGGYGSFGNDGHFLVVDPSAGGQVGANNYDFAFYGFHPETTSGADRHTLVKATRDIRLLMVGCNLNVLTNDTTNPIFDLEQESQSGTHVRLIDCHLDADVRFKLKGNVSLTIDGGDVKANLSDMLLTADRLNVTNYLSPQARIINSTNAEVPDQVYAPMERDQGASFPQPVQSPHSMGMKILPIKGGTTGQSAGLIVGTGNVYKSFEATLPIGATIKLVEVVFVGATISTTSIRTAKVENGDASVTYLPETTWDPAGGRDLAASASLHVPVTDATSQTVVVSVKIPSGTAGGTIGDYGYALVHYI